MLRNDEIRLRHILDAAREAVAFAENRSRNDLDKNRMLSLAFLRLLEVIGEATRGISEELRAAHTEIAWKKMAGMRDRLIHGYFDVNLDVVWETVSQDLPPLITQLQKLLSSEKR